jgi:hypothetical protein
MFSEIDAEERDALREIGRRGVCSGVGGPGVGVIRIAGAGAGDAAAGQGVQFPWWARLWCTSPNRGGERVQ